MSSKAYLGGLSSWKARAEQLNAIAASMSQQLVDADVLWPTSRSAALPGRLARWLEAKTDTVTNTHLSQQQTPPPVSPLQ